MSPRGGPSPLWAVTSFFNPAGYRNRLRNFRVFREHLPFPLLAVELSFDGRFALQADDADLLVQWSTGDVMWQKERLLNGAWSRLPPDCVEVAWLDADIVLTNPLWVAQARAGLQRHKLLHAFRTLRHLPADAGSVDMAQAAGLSTSVQVSVIHNMQQQTARAHLLSGILTRADGAPTPGIAWVARRDWISQVRLFDASIAGGGDTAWAAAVLGVPEQAVDLHAMRPAQRAYYLRWAATPGLALGQDIGCLEGDALHLWHGHMAGRHSRERHLQLAASGFDPGRHLVAGAGEPWRWTDPAGRTARYLRSYFHARNEDGNA